MAEDDERVRQRWELATVSLRPDAARDVPAAPRVRGRFDELGELGRGGMGRVVEAVDRTLGRTVAIKHSLASDPVSLARFQREVLITARLSHPSIMPILDVGHDDDGRPYYVMRRVHGEPLDRRVAAIASVAERVALVPAILAAVDATAYAHAQGVVHRDIKPSNILLGPFGEVLLIDWGLARQLGDAALALEPDRPRAGGLTRAGQTIGTPGFMAPEQARGEPSDRRADVYALGATLHFTLAGRMPFDGVAPTQMIELAAQGTAPAALPEAIPVALAAITRKALAADPAARYADAGELAADLRRFLAGQLVAAHPYTARDRVAHFLRRYRIAAVVGAAALIVLAIGGALSIARILTEEDHANAARELAEDRADELLVDRARAFVARDPTSALAALRELPAASPRWPIAREIVRAAVAAGYDHLVDRVAGAIHAAAFSPSGRLAIAVGIEPGSIRIYDGDQPRTLAERGASALAWLDDRTVAAITLGSGQPSKLVLLDTSSGTRTEVSVDFKRYAAARGRLYLLAGERAVEVTAAGATTELASHIAALDACGGRVALLGHDRLIVIDRDGTRRERPVTLPGRILQVRISASGGQVAAFIYPGVVAWSMPSGREATWPSWPGRYDSLNGIVFAGETLYGWSTVNNTLVSFDPSGVIAQLPFAPPTGDAVKLAGDGDAVVLANHAGDLVYGDALGVIPIAHRGLTLAALALDVTRRRVAIATSDGELVMLELGAALPRTLPAQMTDQLWAAGPDQVVVASDGGVAIIATAGTRTELGAMGVLPFAAITGDHVIAVGGVGGAQPRSLATWSLAGTPERRATGVGSMVVNAGFDGSDSVFYTTEAGAVIEAPLDPARPSRTLAWFPPVTHHGRVMSSITGFELSDRALAVTTAYDSVWSTWIFDRRGLQRLQLGGHQIRSAHRTADGAWWFVDGDQPWRLAPGEALQAVPLAQRTQRLFAIGGRVWALGNTSAFELDARGGVARAVGALGFADLGDRGFVRRSPDGVELVDLASGVTRRLRLSREPLTVRASRDGHTVAALIALDGEHRIAVWTDPVPVLPAALPAYLAGLTTARLAPHSDAVTWAP